MSDRSGEDMSIVTVWKDHIGVHEQCIILPNGDYRGISTLTIYPRGEYYHSPVYLARVVRMLDANETGMIYRETRDHRNMIGSTVEIEEAHYYGGALIWRTVRERAYLNELEIELLSKEPIR